MTSPPRSAVAPDSESVDVADPSPSPAIQPDEPISRSGSFDALLEDFRRRNASSLPVAFRQVDRVRRRLRVAPASAGAALLAVVLGVGVRLGLVLVATAVVGQWSDVPWAAWAVIFAFYGLILVFSTFTFTPSEVPAAPWLKREMEDWSAMLPLLEREEDLRDLDDFMRRWERRSWLEVGAGLLVVAAMLSAAWLVAPTAMNELPAGSIVLLAVLLFDFGSMNIYGGTIGNWVFIGRQARYDYHLFWPSPADSPEVETALRKTNTQGFVTGTWITIFLVLTILLVSWNSPLVLPLGAGFIVIGYLVQFTAALRNRGNIQKIVQRARERSLLGLRSSIEEFRRRYTHPSHDEAEQLRDLLFLYDKIRDAPTTPTKTRTVMHTAVGLIIPTILFIATAFGEVYTERIFDAILP
jgi:hypothetical protein